MIEKQTLDYEQLTESHDFLTLVLDNINSAVFIVDHNNRIKSVNNAFMKLFHQTESELIDQLCGNAIGCIFAYREKKDCSTTSHCSNCIIRHSIINSISKKNSTPNRQKLVRIFHIDGQDVLKHFQFTTKLILYKDEKMVMIIMDDMTELEMQKEHLKRLNELKNKFLGMAAHDLRNPISVISMYTTSILRFFQDNLTDEQIKFLNIIHRSSEFMLSLVEDFLDISTIESGHLTLDMKEQDYTNLVQEVVELNNTIAQKRNITINFQAEPNLPKIFYDTSRIEQVLNNLINNAIKFTSDGDSIDVTLTLEEKYLVTNIYDKGPGIPENDIHKIFDEYQRSTTKSVSGEKQTGLGLAIARKIVKAHNGLIGVHSEKDQGTHFYFKLPRE